MNYRFDGGQRIVQTAQTLGRRVDYKTAGGVEKLTAGEGGGRRETGMVLYH